MIDDVQELFCTFGAESPDFNASDIDAECRRLFERQKAIALMLDGKLPADYVLDMIEEHGGDAAEYTVQVNENLAVAFNELGSVLRSDPLSSS